MSEAIKILIRLPLLVAVIVISILLIPVIYLACPVYTLIFKEFQNGYESLHH